MVHRQAITLLLVHMHIYGTPPKKNLHFLILYRYLQWFLHFWRPFFLGIFLLVLEVVFINVYKHRGCWIQDPRSKILGKTSWIQGLDPRSKIQDSRKNFLDPRSGSKIQDPRFWEKLLGSWILDPDLGSKKFFLESWILDLGSRPWIQEVFPRILDLGSWIQTLDPRSFS